MATLVLRTVKGSPLTNAEVDGNFSNINTEVGVVDSNVGVLSNLTTTAKSNLVAAINEVAAESTSSVNITGGAIANVTASNVSITSGNISGTVITNSTFQGNTIEIAYGGTGQTTRAAAINALLPDQTSNTNYVLKTDGSNISWASDVDTTAVTITNDTATNSTFYIPLTTASTGTINSANVSTTKLFFNPSTGLLSSTDYNSTSDASLKENISSIANPLDVISKLNGVKFTWKDTGERSYGLLAQEVEKILPEVVKERSDGIKGINYSNIIAVLIESIKELKQEIQSLKNYK